MGKAENAQLGGQPPRYSFVFNPYPDMRISSCPYCESKTGQRKIPLLIYVDPEHPIALNYTCRYCRECDLLIAHKHEVEHLLTQLFKRANPAIIGNQYLVIGTLEKSVWKEGARQSKSMAEMLPHISEFAEYLNELRVTQPGWYRQEEEPPIMEPPPSKDWVKSY